MFKFDGSLKKRGRKNKIAIPDFAKLPTANVVKIVSGFFKAAFIIK